MPSSRHLSRVTMLLAVIAAAQVQVALASILPDAGMVEFAAGGLLTFGFWIAIGRRARTDWDLPAVIAVLAIGLLPVAWDPVSRAAFGVGLPYEIQMALVLRNTSLALAAAPRLPRASLNATLGSLFLVLFTSMWSSGPWAVSLLGVYSIVGVWWLLAAYWDGLGGRFADTSDSAIPVRPAAATIVVLAVSIAAAVPLAARSGVTRALAGFFPSSGGTQWSDPFANGGVGDGDQMVAAKEQASSFGPIDSELFLESKMPSLYDAFNEFSEGVPKKTKKARRAIPLAPSQVKMNHQRKGVNQQASREFSAVRQSGKRRSQVDDRLSAALLHVIGRTPQHLALETFDRWDGHSLIACSGGEALDAVLRAVDTSGKRWMELAIERPADAYPAAEELQVRVINLKTDRVPTPAGANAVTMDNLHAASMFKFADDGSLAMDVERVPQLTVFKFRSAAPKRDASPALHRSETGEAPSRLSKLAEEWTRGAPAGWRHVEAIVARLGQLCTHDRDAVVPPDVEDAVDYFLFQSRRGPDYLFATTTALMLRSLGYDTRVRAGFYVNPKRYEALAKITPVLMEDAHFWVEVRTANGARVSKDGESLPGVWATVEPTPGYGLLYAPETLLSWLARLAREGFAAIAAAPVTSLLTVLGVGLIVATRRRLLDAAIIGWWSLRAHTTEAGRLAMLTLRLLEWRAWAHRDRRPAGTPLGRWGVLEAHQDFASLASWALYGSGSAAPLPAGEARAACRRALITPLGPAADREKGASWKS